MTGTGGAGAGEVVLTTSWLAQIVGIPKMSGEDVINLSFLIMLLPNLSLPLWFK